MKLSTETLYRLCNKYQWFTSGDCTNMKKCLSETNKERALKRLQRLFGFARSDTKKNKY